MFFRKQCKRIRIRKAFQATATHKEQYCTHIYIYIYIMQKDSEGDNSGLAKAAIVGFLHTLLWIWGCVLVQFPKPRSRCLRLPERIRLALPYKK
jgi:hypothetical protein